MNKSLRELKDLAEKELNCDLTSLALAWVIKFQHTTSALFSGKTLEQVKQSLNAINVYKKITPEIEGRINKILDNAPPARVEFKDWSVTPPIRPIAEWSVFLEIKFLFLTNLITQSEKWIYLKNEKISRVTKGKIKALINIIFLLLFRILSFISFVFILFNIIKLEILNCKFSCLKVFSINLIKRIFLTVYTVFILLFLVPIFWWEETIGQNHFQIPIIIVLDIWQRVFDIKTVL